MGEMKVFIRRHFSNLFLMSEMLDKLINYSFLYDCSKLTLNKIKSKRNPAIRYMSNLGENVLTLYNELKDGTYKLKPFRNFIVYDPKERHIRSLAICDRVLQRALYELILPVFEKKFIYDTYACLKGRGGEKARIRLSYFINKFNKNKNAYYLKLDVSKYFYSIDTHLLYEIYLKPNLPEDIIYYLKMFVEDNKTGVPIGDLMCQLYANTYLSRIDHFIKNKLKCKYYIRYMDDMVLLSDNKEELKEWKILIESELNKLKLKLNPKSHINKVANGLPFTGYNFYYDCIYAKQKKVRRMKNQIYRFKAGKIKPLKLKDGISSRRGTYLHAANRYIYQDCLKKSCELLNTDLMKLGVK